MTLIVENGTGLAGADAYGSLASFETWAEGRNRVTSAFSDEAKEAALREGFQYINTARRYKGVALTLAQAGEFPRSGLVDWNGRDVTGVPNRVMWANFELAWSRLSSASDLYQDADRGGRVASESVGSIAVSYFADAPSGKTFMAAMKLLDPYARSVQDAFPPFIGGTAGQASTAEPASELTPAFSIGMHANTSD